MAEALAGALNEPEYAAADDIIVVSFSQELVDRLQRSYAPHRWRSPRRLTGVATGSWAATPNPDVSAFQVPPRFTGVPDAARDDALAARRNVHASGYALHVFTENAEDESPVGFQRFLNAGVDGVMASSPGRLHSYLCTAGRQPPRRQPRAARPRIGSWRLPPTPTPAPAAKKCKKGKKRKKGKQGKKLKKGKKKAKCGKKKKKGKGKKGKRSRRSNRIALRLALE